MRLFLINMIWFMLSTMTLNAFDKNSQLIFSSSFVIDYKGSTKIEEPIHQMMLFTNYSKNPIEQWVDNIEIWDDFPCVMVNR